MVSIELYPQKHFFVLNLRMILDEVRPHLFFIHQFRLVTDRASSHSGFSSLGPSSKNPGLYSLIASMRRLGPWGVGTAISAMNSSSNLTIPQATAVSLVLR